MDTTLDPQAVTLAKAIRQTESGGNFQAKGKSGEYGAYQFTQPTWDSYSKKHGVDVALEQATPSQQNEVAYKQIKEWKDQGYNVGQIASLWNSGKPDAYKDESYKGINKKGVSYDVPAYAKNVATAYQALKNGQPIPPGNNPSSVITPGQPNAQGFITSANIPDAPTQTQTDSNGVPGVMDQLNKGNYLGAGESAIRKLGSVLTGGGSEQLGNTIGTLGGYGYEKLKGLFGGKDNSEMYDTSGPTLGSGLMGTAKTIGGIASVAGAGGLLKKLGVDVALGKGVTALENPAITKILQGAVGPGEGIDSLTREGAITRLTAKLSTMPYTGAGGQEEQLILKALKELNPSLVEKQNIALKLIKGGFNLASHAALVNLLGNTVGGLIHQTIPK